MKRGEEWIADTDEEMGKMRRRIEALDNFYFIAALTRVCILPFYSYIVWFIMTQGKENISFYMCVLQ